MRRTDPENSNMRFFRTQDRVFSQNGQWFFTAREGELGPFVTRDAAIQEAARYTQERRDLGHFQQTRELQVRREEVLPLSIVPKEENVTLSLEQLIQENQR